MPKSCEFPAPSRSDMGAALTFPGAGISYALLRLIRRVAIPVVAMLQVVDVQGQPREQVLIDGPTVVMPLVAALAKDFEIRVRDVGFVFERNLGDLRLEALLQGKLDIAVVTNGINTAFISKEGMVAHKVARSAVVFAVNSG